MTRRKYAACTQQHNDSLANGQCTSITIMSLYASSASFPRQWAHHMENSQKTIICIIFIWNYLLFEYAAAFQM